MLHAPVAAASALAVLAALSFTSRSATAHGTVDQSIGETAYCNFSNFPGEAPADGATQTFKPAREVLSAVDLCLVGDGEINVAIRDENGALIAETSTAVAPMADLYTHVNLAAPYEVSVNSPYTIELATGDNITWRGEAPGGLYAYDRGESNSGVVADFAFRSYYAPVPPTAVPSATNTTQATATRKHPHAGAHDDANAAAIQHRRPRGVSDGRAPAHDRRRAAD